MRKWERVTKRVAAVVLSTVLAIGLVPGTAMATETRADAVSAGGIIVEENIKDSVRDDITDTFSQDPGLGMDIDSDETEHPGTEKHSGSEEADETFEVSEDAATQETEISDPTEEEISDPAEEEISDPAEDIEDNAGIKEPMEGIEPATDEDGRNDPMGIEPVEEIPGTQVSEDKGFLPTQEGSVKDEGEVPEDSVEDLKESADPEASAEDPEEDFAEEPIEPAEDLADFVEELAKPAGIPESPVEEPEAPVEESLPAPQVTILEDTFVYDGKEHCPRAAVMYNGRKKDTDFYEISCDRPHADVGTYDFTVTFIDIDAEPYTGTFTIIPRAITPSVSLSDTTLTYNGKAQKPRVTVMDGCTSLSKSDYTVKYPANPKDIGRYKVSVTLKGNYKGTGTAAYEITKKKITPIVRLSKTSFAYNGRAQRPSVTVKDGAKVLSAADYTVSIPKSVNAGSYKTSVTLKGNYEGTGTAAYKITPGKAAPNVSLSKKSLTYNGRTQKPAVTVKIGKTKLATSAYTVSWSGIPKNVGTYKAVVKLKGNYTGSKTVPFKIIPAGTDITYVVNAWKTMTVKWAKRTKQVTGYQIQYSRSKSFSSGNNTITVRKASAGSRKIKKPSCGLDYYVRIRTYTKTGKNTFYSAWSSGVKSSVILPSIKLSTAFFTYNGKAQKPKITVMDGARKLPASTYTVKYPRDPKNAGTYKVTVRLSTNYTGLKENSGSKTVTYKILPKKITPSVRLSKTSFTCNKKVQKPSVTVKDRGRKLPASAYTVKYSGNSKDAGTYQATVTLKGNYSGTKTVAYRITEAVEGTDKKDENTDRDGRKKDNAPDTGSGSDKKEEDVSTDNSVDDKNNKDTAPEKKDDSGDTKSDNDDSISSQSSMGGKDSGNAQEKIPGHTHVWVDNVETIHHNAETHTEQVLAGTKTVVDKEAWDESVYEIFAVCHECGFKSKDGWDLDVHLVTKHYVNGVFTSYSYKDLKTGTIHHPAITHEEPVYEKVKVVDEEAWDETVVTGQKCSECGAVK